MDRNAYNILIAPYEKQGLLELIVQKVDKDGVLNMLYKRHSITHPDFADYDLYQEYPDKQEKLYNVLPTIARKTAKDLGLSEERCLEVFGEETQVTESDMNSIQEPAAIRGYWFMFDEGMIIVDWLQLDSVKVHKEFDLHFYATGFGVKSDSDEFLAKFHEVLSWHVEGAESIDKLTLYKEALAIANKLSNKGKK